MHGIQIALQQLTFAIFIPIFSEYVAQLVPGKNTSSLVMFLL